MEHYLVVGNGEFNKHIIKKLRLNKIVVALDGAANQLSLMNIKPDIILGDLDSIHIQTLHSNIKTQIILKVNQDYTDLEKAIYYCDEQKAKSITLLGVIGGTRTDHTFMAFSCLKRYFNINRRLIIIHTDILEYACNQTVAIHGNIGQKISFFGFPKAIVSSSGLKWNLKNMKCTLGIVNSCYNEFVEKNAILKIKGSGIIIYSHNLFS